MSAIQTTGDKEWHNKLKAEGYYYIHAHRNRYNGTTVSQYLKDKHQEWYNNMLTRFTNNWYNATNLNPKVIDALAVAGNKEAFMRKVNQELTNTFNNAVKNSPEMQQGITATKDAYTAIDKYMQSSDTQAQLNAMNNFLTQVSKISGLIGPAGEELQILLINWITNQGTDAKMSDEMMGSLVSEINRLKGEWSNKPRSASKKRILSIMNSLNSLAIAIQNGELSKRSFQGFAKGIFSTNFAEMSAVMIQNKAIAGAGKQARKVMNNQLTGDQSVSMKYLESSEMMNYINKDNKRTFKTDAKNNITLTVENIVNEQGGQLNLKIDLGTTVKWYRSLMGQRKNLLSGNINVASESGGLENRALQIFDNNVQLMTNFYNAIAHRDNDVLNNFAKALVYRNLDFMIAGYGVQGDFSQLMFVNGKFISVYEILVQSLNKVSTMPFWNSSNKGIGVVFDSKIQKVQNLMPPEEFIESYPSPIAAYSRAKYQNQKLQQSAIAVYVNASKFLTK